MWGVFAAINPLDKDAVIEMKKKMKKNVIIKKTNNYNKYNSLD